MEGQKEEIFDDLEIFSVRAHNVIYLSKPNKPFIIRDYVMSEDWPTRVIFERLENGKFDIKIEED